MRIGTRIRMLLLLCVCRVDFADCFDYCQAMTNEVKLPLYYLYIYIILLYYSYVEHGALHSC